MNEISKTGYWDGETAHHHHVHSEKLSEWICEFIEENIKEDLIYVTDFGCGLGQYLRDIINTFKNDCVCVGVEGNIPKESVYSYTLERDLTTDLTKEYEFCCDLSISLEVGEHIPKEHMNTYLDNITHHAEKYLITSWAVRGQDGFGHVNCLDNHEIIPEFEKRGFKLMEKETEDARSLIEDKCWWFKNTLFILKRI
jgi:hypothetical protein